MINEILHETETKMKQTIHVLEQDLLAMRTGRASTALVEKVTVDYYGAQTPLIQLAGISVPEPQTIMISPYDRSTISDIERAILASDLGLNPNSDGTVIRLNIPSLTKERRQQLVKMMHKRLEEARVGIRNIRRHAMDDARDFHKDGEVSEDELKNGQEKIQKLTDHYIKEVDDMGKRKEAEIMEV